jgi:hypothetical protein
MELSRVDVLVVLDVFRVAREDCRWVALTPQAREVFRTLYDYALTDDDERDDNADVESA